MHGRYSSLMRLTVHSKNANSTRNQGKQLNLHFALENDVAFMQQAYCRNKCVFFGNKAIANKWKAHGEQKRLLNYFLFQYKPSAVF